MRWIIFTLLLLSLPVMAEKQPVFGPVSAPTLAKLPPKMAEAKQQADAIVAAVAEYEKEQGHPPESLSSLIPKPFDFLPDPPAKARTDWTYWNCERSWVLAVGFEDGSTLAYGARVLPSSIPGFGALKVRLGQWGVYE
ncbi:MAG: hypothetical protein AB7S38_38715 [Vulcanimicrobiota bacterium]